MRSGHRSRALLPVLFLAVSPSSVAVAQPPASPPFGDEQQVTAVDVMVEVAARRQRQNVPALPSYLAPDDFEVVYDGGARKVVGVSAFGPAQNAHDGEPWTIVIYFDRRLVNPADASWAAGELFAAAERLTGLGTVEVVAADPEPQPLAEPTRDADRLASALAEIALFPEGNDHELLRIRDELLGELGKADSQIDPAELVPFAVADEKRVVRRQLDALVTWLAAQEAGTRRALFLVGGGFDLEPEGFYRPRLGRAAKEALAGETGSLESDLEALGRTLAAYGWITFPVVPPAQDPPSKGVRIGKWRLGAPRGDTRETAVDPLHPEETVGPVMLDFLNLTREGNHDPKKAEAYLEFGAKLAQQDDLQEAEQAFRMALYHFDEAPATAGRQAVALVRLGEVLEGQGRRREARAAFQEARRLDPESIPADETPLGELLAPDEPLEKLGAWTTGSLVRGGDELSAALAALPYRVRVTYQLPGPPDGTLHPLEVRCRRRGCDLFSPAWARSGTPDEVAAARVRRWLAEDEFEGQLDVAARPVPGGHRIAVELALPGIGAGEDGGAPALRLTLGFGDPESITAVRHERRAAHALEGEGKWGLEIDYDPDLLPAEGSRGVVVAVEHLATGRWGATVVELPEAGGR